MVLVASVSGCVAVQDTADAPAETESGSTGSEQPDDDDSPPTASGPDGGTSTGAGDPTGVTGDSTTGPLPSTGSDGEDSSTGVDVESSSTESSGPDETTGGVATGISFIEDPDPNGLECSTWEQDCPDGEKCNAWADDGGPSWNATHCVPLDPAPRQIGQSCEVLGSGVSGVDDCVEGAICWDVDAQTLVGTCVGYCEGTPANPQCGAGLSCVVSNAGVLPLCLPSCDPVVQNCGPGQGCYPVDGSFTCAPDASGPAGAYPDPCVSINTCDPGLACIGAAAVPGCAGALGCCSPFCDTGAPNTCPAVDQQCAPWFQQGQAPPGYDHLGVCAVLP